jgi:hypothetical protein
MADGKPNLQGYYMPDGGGGNYGLGKHDVDFLTPGGRGIVVDPPDGTLPVLPWAQAEMDNRKLPERGYDDPTAHCFVAGVPRSMYIPAPLHILQPPGFVVVLHERMSWRVIALDGRPHLPDSMRLWQGDSVGRWEGDTLVVETTNLTDKLAVGRMPHSEDLKLTERFTRIDPDMIDYVVTVDDPRTFERPWTYRLTLTTQPGYEVLEYSCHEGNFFVANALKAEKVYQERVREAKAKGEPIPERPAGSRGRSIFAPPDASEAVDINATE